MRATVWDFSEAATDRCATTIADVHSYIVYAWNIAIISKCPSCWLQFHPQLYLHSHILVTDGRSIPNPNPVFLHYHEHKKRVYHFAMFIAAVVKIKRPCHLQH